MLDAVGEAVIATDPEGRIIYWNDAATRMFGWEPSEVLGSNVLEVTPARGMRRYAAEIMASLQQGESWSGEFETRTRDGETFPVLVTNAPMLDDAGRLVGMVGISRDIRTQRGTEASLQQSEERLELIRRAAQSVIWELEPVSRTIRWSDALGDVFGYVTDDVDPGVEWWLERIHPEDRARLESDFTAFLTDDRRFWTKEYRFRRADGSYAKVFDRAYASYGPDGETKGMAGAIIDLTERRRLQDERRLLGQASMILDLSLDYEATLPTLVKLVTNAMADFCVLRLVPASLFPGFTAAAHADPQKQDMLEEIAGQMAPTPAANSFTARVLRNAEPMILQNVAEAVHESREAGPLRDLALQLEPTSALILPVRARSQVFGFMILGRNHHTPPYDDADLRVGEELARRIGTAVDHARLYESEQLAHKAKADFLAIMSHELRTPLTAVLGYADLLADEISGPLNEQQKGQIQRIRAGTDRLHRLLESILAYVRLETANDRPRFHTVEVHDILDRVREVIEPRAREDGAAFRMEVGELPSHMVTDADRMLQVLLALLTNALKFAGHGEVILRVAARDGFLELDVVDSGHGIPEEHQPHVFNAFWQAEQPSTRRASGAGLGLTLARRLARLLGGDVVIGDSSPRGTTFRFLLPIREPQ